MSAVEAIAKVIWTGKYLGGQLSVAKDIKNNNLLYFTYESLTCSVIGNYMCLQTNDQEVIISDLQEQLSNVISQAVQTEKDSLNAAGTLRLQ